MSGRELELRVHLPNLLDEVLANPQCAILRVPIMETKRLLAMAAERAAELDDPELNAVMLKLALYDVPPDRLVDEIAAEERRAEMKQKKDGGQV